MVTDFIKNKEVRTELKRLFTKPVLITKPLINEAISHNPTLLGNAFDYYLEARFINKNILSKDTLLEKVENYILEWKQPITVVRTDLIKKKYVKTESTYLPEQVCWCCKSYGGANMLRQHYGRDPCRFSEIFFDEKESRITGKLAIVYCYSNAELANYLELSLQHYKRYKKDGKHTNEFLKALLVFAGIFPGLKFVAIAKNVNNPDEKDITALRELIKTFPKKLFLSDKILIKPSLSHHLIMGRPDYIIGDMIVDIKTTKVFFSLEHFLQLVCYYLLYRIEKEEWTSQNFKITKIGIYYSYYSYLLEFDVDEIFDSKNVSEAIKYIELIAQAYVPFQNL